MRMPKITPEIVVAILLFLAIVSNTISHVSSPAYKYYRDNVSALRQDCKRFEAKITNDLIPYMAFAMTNNSDRVVGNTSVANDKSVNGDAPIKPLILSYRYFLAGGKCYAEISGRYYTLGDTICGEPIVSLDATCITTPNRMYVSQSFGGQHNRSDTNTKPGGEI